MPSADPANPPDLLPSFRVPVEAPKPKDNRTRVVSVRRVSFLHPVRLEKRPHTSWPEEPKHGPVEVTLQPFGVEVAGSLIPWANVAQVDYA